MSGNLQIDIPREAITAFCKKWKVAELSLFGSILREDFGPGSDVDVLVSFAEGAGWSLYDWVDMIEELRRSSDGRWTWCRKRACAIPSGGTTSSITAR